ncbi:MAG: TolB family protein [Planctomycetota bacterium]
MTTMKPNSNMHRTIFAAIAATTFIMLPLGCAGNGNQASRTDDDSWLDDDDVIVVGDEGYNSTAPDGSLDALLVEDDNQPWNDDIDGEMTGLANGDGWIDPADPPSPAVPDEFASEPQAPPTDPFFTLFGQVNGQSGDASPFAASEAISQVSFAAEGNDFSPDVDPSGQFMVYTSTQHSNTKDIYHKSVGGRTVTQMTNDPADDDMAAYSPDGSQIAFCSNRRGNWDIYVMDVSGGPAFQVTSDRDHELHPSWSPDGQMLVYSRLSSQSGRWEMWVVEFGQTAIRKFIGYGLFPEWCPDPEMNKITFQRARERGSNLFSVWTIDFIDGEGHRPTEIASFPNTAAINPAWSPDGSKIAFSTVPFPDKVTPDNPPKVADVWVVNLDGTARVNLTNGAFANFEPTWGTANRVYFRSDRSGVDNIWMIEPEHAMRTAQGPEMISGPRNEFADVPTFESSPIDR